MITRTALHFVAAIIAANSMSPAFGQTQGQGDDVSMKRRAASEHKRSVHNGQNAPGMPPLTEFQLDPNSPEATGGGSPGYNERL